MERGTGLKEEEGRSERTAREGRGGLPDSLAKLAVGSLSVN